MESEIAFGQAMLDAGIASGGSPSEAATGPFRGGVPESSFSSDLEKIQQSTSLLERAYILAEFELFDRPDGFCSELGIRPFDWDFLAVPGETFAQSAAFGLAAKRLVCPELVTAIDEMLASPNGEQNIIFNDGTYEVGVDIAAGTWRSGGEVSDCYWERVDASGRTIENDFVTGAPRVVVNVSNSDAAFVVDGCRLWYREP